MKFISVRTADRTDRERVFATIVRAFEQDPAARWLYPEREDYLRHFPAFARAFGGRAFEAGMVHEAAGGKGAALWLAPGTHPDETAVVDLIARSAPKAEQAALFSAFEQMGRYHPDERHWYLPLIGVDPREQGRGYGSALLHRALLRCDAERIPAYLESSNPLNIPLYERHGFEVMGTIQVGRSPPITPMLRRPRP
jgi:ribosomal protein S18 acetylase RimI-like enzyme